MMWMLWLEMCIHRTHKYTSQGLDPSGSKASTLDISVHVTALSAMACGFLPGLFEYQTRYTIHFIVIVAHILYISYILKLHVCLLMAIYHYTRGTVQVCL